MDEEDGNGSSSFQEEQTEWDAGGRGEGGMKNQKQHSHSVGGKDTSISDAARRGVISLSLGAALLIGTLMAVMMPFFPEFARVHLQASSVLVGIIFALLPITSLLASPLVGMASTRYGRGRVLLVGLLLVGVGTLCFGLVSSSTQAVLARVLQGLGAACVNVAALALLLQVSVNVERDVGLLQAAAGLGFLVGPPLGGLMYKHMGFLPVFATLAAVCFTMASLLVSAISCIPQLTHLTTSSSSSPISSSFRAMMTMPVMATAATNTVAFMALGFCYPIDEIHFERALGVDPAGVGLLFMIPSITYILVAAMAELFVKRLGPKETLSTGLLLLILTSLVFGPAPFLTALPWTRLAVWVTQIASMVVFGTGFCFVLVSNVPLLKSYLSPFGPEGDDFISALDSSSYALGEALADDDVFRCLLLGDTCCYPLIPCMVLQHATGPLLAGVTMAYLPHLKEVSCRPTPQLLDCRTGTSWSFLAFGCLLVVVLVVFRAATRAVPPPPPSPSAPSSPTATAVE